MAEPRVLSPEEVDEAERSYAPWPMHPVPHHLIATIRSERERLAVLFRLVEDAERGWRTANAGWAEDVVRIEELETQLREKSDG